MNKVVLTVGSITVIVVGGLFFCAGMFTGADLNDKNNITVKEIIPQDMATKLKNKVTGLLNRNSNTEIKVLDTSDNQKLIDEDDLALLQSPSKSGILLERPSQHITVDSLLNEVISSHDTTDQCLLDNVKTKQRENVILNDTKKNLVFIGYFPVNIAKQISKLLMTKGYPTHVQNSNMTDSEAFVFCGPFKKESRANILVKWLQKHDFVNAKIVKGTLLKSEKIDEDVLKLEITRVPINADNMKPKKIVKNNKKVSSDSVNRKYQLSKKKTSNFSEEDDIATPYTKNVNNNFDNTNTQEEHSEVDNKLTIKNQLDSEEIDTQDDETNIEYEKTRQEDNVSTSIENKEENNIENNNEDTEVNDITDVELEE